MDMQSAQVAFPAMGSTCAVTVYVPAGAPEGTAATLAALARARSELLHAAWTRFDKTSELSHLNGHAGTGPVHVSSDLWLLLTRMRDAWLATEGKYDPTVHRALVALGYDRPFTATSWHGDVAPVRTEVPGMRDIIFDAAARTVSLPRDFTVDPGGIGKGVAADVVAAEIMQAGASGVLVDMGGDLAVRGEPDSGEWRIDLPQHPHHRHGPDAEQCPVLALPAHPGFAVSLATSGLRARQWGTHLYHVLDPATGMPADSSIAEVTVLSRAGWLAEAHTKAALLADSDAEGYLQRHDVAGLVHWADGTTTSTLPTLTPTGVFA